MKRFRNQIKAAIALAKDNPHKFRLGCVVLNRHGKIVGTGINSEKTHPLQKRLAKRNGHKDQEGLHAEIAALIRKKESVHTLIVVRLLRNGSLAMAAPCPICCAAISIAGVKNVIYSNKFMNFTWEKRK